MIYIAENNAVHQAFVLMFVGTALAIGLHIDIGITVQTLADSLGMANSKEPIHPQLVAFLLSKASHIQPEVCDPVRTYACSWWLQSPMADVELFGPRTIMQCLQIHRQEQHVAGVFRNTESRPFCGLLWPRNLTLPTDAILAFCTATRVPNFKRTSHKSKCFPPRR